MVGTLLEEATLHKLSGPVTSHLDKVLQDMVQKLNVRIQYNMLMPIWPAPISKDYNVPSRLSP